MSDCGVVETAPDPLTVSVTLTLCGLFEAPGAVNVIVPLYEPGESPVESAVIDTAPGVTPFAGVALSQFPPLVVDDAAV